MIKLVSFAMLLLSILTASSAGANGRSYKDSDWNTTVFDNCGLPVSRGENQSVSWVMLGSDKKLRFILKEGDKGKCSTDNQSRNHAPFWERSEVRQKNSLRLGYHYRIKVEVTLLEGFLGERESFFQIHGWNGNCRAYPPMMMMFDRGKLKIWALRGVSGNGMGAGRGSHRSVQTQSLRVSSLKNVASDLVIDFDTRTNPGRLSISLNGASIAHDVSVEFAPCAKPHIKMGIYRPGGKGSGTSTVLFDNLLIERLSN